MRRQGAQPADPARLLDPDVNRLLQTVLPSRRPPFAPSYVATGHCGVSGRGSKFRPSASVVWKRPIQWPAS